MLRIKRVALEFMLNLARNMYPREFIGLLRENEKKEISEVLLLPRSTYGRGFSSIDHYMVPYTVKYVGSVHSHPTPNARPSAGDLLSFSKTGGVHIIVAYPFTENNIGVYSNNGEKLEYEVVE
ncbi:MAG: Mov34/MPN/PAD-1 family protein [Candidatus Micrarchaeota archaeon]|nr:Mov34/MPN/PAD-1 family protein [Candidatus Micrarchaeota archaeon]